MKEPSGAWGVGGEGRWETSASLRFLGTKVWDWGFSSLLWAGRLTVSHFEDGEIKAAVRGRTASWFRLGLWEPGSHVEAQPHCDLAVSPGQGP